MLVLSRKVKEGLVIGEGTNKITVSVLKVEGSRVRLGIEAPKTTKILRSEIEPTPEDLKIERWASE